MTNTLSHRVAGSNFGGRVAEVGRASVAEDVPIEHADRSTRVRILDSWASLEKVSGLWRAWQYNPNADLEFFRFIVGIREECERPYVVCVEHESATKTLLVGRLERQKVAIRVGYFTLARPEIRLINFVHGGLLGDLGQSSADELVKAVIARIAAGDADAAYFSHFPQNSALSCSLKKMPRFFRRERFTSAQAHRSMKIPDSMDGFYARLSPKVRKNQKWQAKKLLEAFAQEVQIRPFTAPEHLNTMFNDVDRIASTTYQRGLGVGFADTPEMRGRLQLAATNGWLQTFVLYLGGEPAAFWVGTRYRNRFFSDFMGYDAAHAKHSPGMYLILKSIESFCNERGSDRITEVDFGLGDAQYKQILATDSWMDESLYLYSASLRGMALNYSSRLTGMVDLGGRNILRKLRIENYVKTAWRRRLAPR